MNTSMPSLRRDGLAHNLRRMVEETESFLQAAAQTGDEKLMTIRGQLAEQVRNMRWQLDELEDNAVHGPFGHYRKVASFAAASFLPMLLSAAMAGRCLARGRALPSSQL